MEGIQDIGLKQDGEAPALPFVEIWRFTLQMQVALANRRKTSLYHVKLQVENMICCPLCG